MKANIITLLVLSSLYIQSIAQLSGTLNPTSRNKEQVAAPLPAVVSNELIWSEKVNDEFNIFVSLPPDYDSLRFEKYPVVYFLDGGSNTFHNINAEYMAQELIPQVITIGIGYPGSTQRTRDYTYGFTNYEYLTLSCHVYEGKDHSTNKEITFRDGIQWAMDQELRLPTHATPSLMAQSSVATSLYPNPVTNQLNLSISPSVNSPVICHIKDMNGKQVSILEDLHPKEHLLKIPVSHLPKGVYIVHLTSGAQQQTIKFIK